MATHEPLLFRTPTARDLFPEKTASALSRMPDDDKKWPAHIYSEMMRELPFLAQYDVEIVLDRTDPEAGAALGYAQVRNKTMSRPQDNVATPGNIIRVPIIVQDRRLQKFYVFEAGKQVYPLNEARVEQAMLNPAVFDTDATRMPASSSLIEQLYPPYQTRNGFGRVADPAALGLSKISAAPGHEKRALIFGARHPGNAYLGSPAVSQQDREDTVMSYGRQKADEEPTARWKAILGGMGVGGATGAGLGAMGAGARGAVVGGAVGAGAGALAGHAAQESDEKEVRKWKTAKEEGPDAERKIAKDRIKGAVESNADEERQHRRRMEMALIGAVTRPHETHHHYHSTQRD